MDYLSVLRRSNPENTHPDPTAKTAKSPFDSKDSAPPVRISESEGAPNASELTEFDEGKPRYRWGVSGSNGVMEVCCLPEMNADEMRAYYPGAALVPLPDTVGKTDYLERLKANIPR